MSEPVERALLSLEGLSVGDAFGETFFWVPPPLISRELPPGPWRWTDDTHMALSVVEVLREHGRIHQDTLACAFATRFMEEPYRGYAAGASSLLARIAHGETWQNVARALFGGGSYGNGGAMRAAPIGGFFAGDPARAAAEARLAAVITHAHPEGQAGAMAVAAAAAIAATRAHPSGLEFLREALRFIPDGLTGEGARMALDIAPDRLSEAADRLGTGRHVSSQDTVPFCLWSAAYHLDAFKEAMWTTVQGLGDRDTTCAIVGGIVALSARDEWSTWVGRREPLPPGFERLQEAP